MYGRIGMGLVVILGGAGIVISAALEWALLKAIFNW